MFSAPPEIAIGVITLWAGGLGNIPPRWHLCDGTAGTPDLRSKFIPATGPIFAVGSEAGATPHLHSFTADGHFHQTVGTGDIHAVPSIYGKPLDSAVLSGITDPAPNLPKYYALAYIQYLGP